MDIVIASDKTYANGVQVIKGTGYNSEFRTVIIPPAAIDQKRYVYSQGECKLAETVSGFDIVVNAFPFNVSTCKAIMGLCTQGTRYVAWSGSEPFLALDGLTISHGKTGFNSHNEVAQMGRYLIENNAKNWQVVDKPEEHPEWFVPAPRTIFGTRNGNLIILQVSAPNYPIGGWTFDQCADYGLSLGCDMMIDGDGGRSTHGVVMINGEQDVLVGAVGYHDSVPGFLAVKLKEPLADTVTPPPPTGGDAAFTLDVEGYQPYSGVLKPNA